MNEPHPSHVPHRPHAAMPPEPKLAGPRAGTVYIVDDDANARESVKALVTGMGFRTELHESAESFLSQVGTDVDGCVLVDLRMHGMSGLELLERLSGSAMPVPVVLVTAYATTPTTVRAMRMGAVSVLDKPLNEHQLWDAVREGLRISEARRAARSERRELEKRFDSLTSQESQVLQMVLDGLTNRQIASNLDVSTRTVESRRHNIFRKTKTTSVPDLVKLTVAYKQLDQTTVTSEL